MLCRKSGVALIALLVFMLMFTIAVTAEQQGLVVHYAFEENLEDSTGNFEAGQPIGNRIGSTIGVVTDQIGSEYASIEYVEGVKGSAAKFDGLTGVLLPSGLIDGSTYSICLWIYPEALTQHTTTLFGAATSSSWISIVPDGPTTHYTMLWSGEAWYDATAGLTIPLNEWTHFAATVDQGQVIVYINGEETFVGENFPDVFGSVDDETVFALAVNWWDAPFRGMLDELKIYDRVLEPGEIVNEL